MKYNLDAVTLMSYIDDLSLLYNAIMGTGLAVTLKGADAVTLFGLRTRRLPSFREAR